jgi:hypothetical protein
MDRAEDPDQEAQEYVAKVRSAPAEQLVTEVLFTLLNTAQVKLGRRDARLFIDLSGLVYEHARRYMSGELTRQVDQALGQLRLAQVRAEGDAARQQTAAEPNDLAEIPAPPASAGSAPSDTPSPAQSPPASNLWVPGRDF